MRKHFSQCQRKQLGETLLSTTQISFGVGSGDGDVVDLTLEVRAAKLPPEEIGRMQFFKCDVDVTPISCRDNQIFLCEKLARACEAGLPATIS